MDMVLVGAFERRREYDWSVANRTPQFDFILWDIPDLLHESSV